MLPTTGPEIFLEILEDIGISFTRHFGPLSAVFTKNVGDLHSVACGVIELQEGLSLKP